MDLEQIIQWTIDLGEGWGYPHAARVHRLTEIIGAEVDYDRTALDYAVYLHDWGAFPAYLQPGVDHALRSRQVAEAEILPAADLPAAVQALIAEAIELHDYRNPRPPTTVESLLLREADWLDMLGVIGVSRELAWGPNNLALCVERILARRAGIAGRFTLPAAQRIAEQRLAQMDALLRELQEESFGML